MSTKTLLSSTVHEKLASKVQSDPGLPEDGPTTATWQLPPNAMVSDIHSDELDDDSDFIVIGSGVTGCSVAKTILEHASSNDKRVTVLEARTLTSGATGRNGGHLASAIPEEFEILCHRFGRDAAIKIGRYCRRTLVRMTESAVFNGTEIEAASEVRNVESVISFSTRAAFDDAVRSAELYTEALPEERSSFRVISGQTAREDFNIKNSAGAIVATCGAFWPYRLITGIFSQLVEKYPQRLKIETQTPVMSVTYSPDEKKSYPYAVHTFRGIIRAGKVLYCTNGWTGHLLPALRGRIFPIRGTMSCQKSGPEFPNLGGTRSWSFFSGPNYDPTEELLETGLYYMQQNEKTGDIFIGGEKQHIDEIITADDRFISEVSKKNLSTILPRLFKKGWGSDPPEIAQIWSGIMGFTADHLPLVGNLPYSVTQRGGEGEFIAAGFNGYGMPQCWSSGEAAALMALGQDIPQWLPEQYLVTEERLADEDRMGVNAAISTLI